MGIFTEPNEMLIRKHSTRMSRSEAKTTLHFFLDSSSWDSIISAFENKPFRIQEANQDE